MIKNSKLAFTCILGALAGGRSDLFRHKPDYGCKDPVHSGIKKIKKNKQKKKKR